MADTEARIRDLQKRVEREPGSRFFVPLAEEYRRAGRLVDAISTLETGLATHGGYVAARIALARAYLEAGKIEDSMSAFSKALADDPSNLVAAKALGDLHLSRGEPLEALKRYLRYRAISGDRRLDALIDRLETETAPAPPPPEAPPLLPPTLATPDEPVAPAAAPADLLGPLALPEPIAPARRATDPFDITGIPYKRPSGPVHVAAEEPEVVSRDLSLDSIASSRRRDGDEEIITRKIRLPEATWPFEPATTAPSEAMPAAAGETAQPDVAPASAGTSSEPTGRTLADLYFEQEHYPEALAIYRDLAAADPADKELARLRDESERLAASLPPRDLPQWDPARERRLAKIRVLNEWLDVIRSGSGNRKPETGNPESSGS